MSSNRNSNGGDNPYMYNGFNVRSHGDRSNRPRSAGATRSRNGSFGYSSRNPGSSSNLYSGHHSGGISSGGLHGHGLHGSNGHQRPASAGHSRPTVASTGHQHHRSSRDHHAHNGGSTSSHHSHHSHHHSSKHKHGASGGQPISHILNMHNIPSNSNGSGAPQHYHVHASSTGHARPRSAGAVRRPNTEYTATNNKNLFGASNSSNSSTGSAGAAGNNGGAVSSVAANLAQQQFNRYAQQQQVRPAPTVDPHIKLNKFGISANAVAANAANGGSSGARPLSANATSMTTNPSQFAKTYEMPTDHWNSNYKINYGHSAATTVAPTTGIGSTANATYRSTGKNPSSGVPAPATTPQVVSYGPSEETNEVEGTVPVTQPSATASKLRSAVDLGHKIEAAGVSASNAGNVNTNAAAAISGAAAAAAAAANAKAAAKSENAAATNPGSELNGVDNGEDEDEDEAGDVMGLDAQRPQTAGGTQFGAKRGAEGDAEGIVEKEEMDGKPVDQSRSHPEVSMTTPSASVELAHASSSLHQNHASNGGVDMRNSSFDSFSEDNINVGLSTVPNQFCTKRDAVELKKLISLSQGTRGGIVPSSSAVMDMYMVGKVVGVGSYGKVRAAWHRLTSSKVAIKTYDKSKLKDPAHWKRVHSEIKIMEQISHPRIARMYEAVETPKRMHLIMECLDGGNLCSYVKAKRRLSEEESKRIFFQILQAIEYLHSLGVSHRDVKLENVLFESDRDIKLIDFGFSTVCQPGKKLKVFCGTPSYMAPEIVRRSEYEGKPVDMWSMGILLYALLCGCFPFRAKAYPDLYRRIARGTFPMPEELSAPVKDLLKQLLTVDADQRITAHSALRHSWLQTQLVNAPNMDRLRLETAILISDKPADDLDDQVIAEIEKFGMSRDEVIRLVLTKTHSSLATLYYLLLNVIVSRRSAATSRKHSANSGSTMRYKVHNQQYNNGAVKVRDAPMGGAQHDLMAQQAAAEQAALQQHQQNLMDSKQQYQGYQRQNSTGFSRPRSASQNSRGGATAQRPLSAYAGRR